MLSICLSCVKHVFDTFFLCLFGVFRPTREFFTHFETSPWRAANFDLCSALIAIEQWGYLSVPFLLWHGASICNGHLRGSVRLIPIAERLAVELLITTCLNDLDLSRLRFEHPTFGFGERSNPLRHRLGVFDTFVKQLCSLYMLKKHMCETRVKHMFNICLTCKYFFCLRREAELTTAR